MDLDEFYYDKLSFYDLVTEHSTRSQEIKCHKKRHYQPESV